MSPAEPYTFDRVVRFIITLLGLAAFFWVLHYASDVLVPLALALLVAYLLAPLVAWVQRLVRHRVAAVLITVTGLMVVVLALSALVVPFASRELSGSWHLVREAVQTGSPLGERLRERLPALASELNTLLGDQDLHDLLREDPSLRALLLSAAKRVVPGLWGLVHGSLAALGFMLQGFLVLIYLVLLLVDFRLVQEHWRDYLPPHRRDDILAFLGEFEMALARHFRGQFIIALAVGVLFALGFLIVGLKMAVLLGLSLGLLTMVPYLQLIAVPPAYLLAVLTALEHDRPLTGYLIGVTLVFVAVQLIQDLLITPRVMGKVTGLRPVVILFSVFLWGKLLGFLGVLLAIPLTCLGLAYYRRWLSNTV